MTRRVDFNLDKLARREPLPREEFLGLLQNPAAREELAAAEAVLARHKDSGITCQYVAEYFFSGLNRSHFLAHFAQQHEKPARVIPPRALRALEAHDWPGNVREIQNVIERAVIVSEGEELVFDPAWLVSTSPTETARTWAGQEKERILAALRAAKGRVYGPGGAAQRLGLKPTTLYGKMRKHGIKREADWL